ncbi:cuticle protein 10.9-like [Stegodyphus dumicola]|uniref:cuticle protein 10.9-like n=1 Tax=Stegodyphus dumicola TaxID=202533 RepID=UPI0015A7ECF0|nr:cuticle protein 10.9-like [Stegodyphus dumicola]
MLSKIWIVCALLSIAFASYYEEHNELHEPKPYHFGYEAKGKHGSHYHKEAGDGHGTVHGSYGYTDEKGVYREVIYVADHKGFRAEVKTNEPGTTNQNPAHVRLDSSSHHDSDQEWQGYHQEQSRIDYAHQNQQQPTNYAHYFQRREGEHGGHE